MIGFEVKWNMKLDEVQRGLALPVLEMAKMLAADLFVRIQQGIASDGYFRAMGAGSNPTPGRGLFWVSPTRPQPPGYVIKVGGDAPLLRGWAGYDSYADYAKALGNQPRDFHDTGHMMNSLKAKVMGPGRVKITFYGSAKRRQEPKSAGGSPKLKTNRETAWLASRDERQPMLMPTPGEMASLQQYLVAHFEAIVAAGRAQDAVSRKRKPAASRRR